jgi:xeroderma pigmentosum group C-complementing protein
MDWVHGVDARRERQRRANRAAGAPDMRPPRRRKSQNRSLPPPSPESSESTSCSLLTAADRLLMFASYLSIVHDRDPQLAERPFFMQTNHGQAKAASTMLHMELLLLAMVRSLGWRARLVQAIEPIPLDLTVDHPLLAASSSCYGAVFRLVYNHTQSTASATNGRKRSRRKVLDSNPEPFPDAPGTQWDKCALSWLEILCTDPQTKIQQRWVHVDPVYKLVDRPDYVETLLGQDRPPHGKVASKKRSFAAYVVAAEHCPVSHDHGTAATTRLRLTDVTPRYAASWVESLRKRGIVRSKKCSIDSLVRQSWWTRTLKTINNGHEPSNMSKTKSTTPPTKQNSGASLDQAIELDELDGQDENATVAADDIADAETRTEAEELQTLAEHETIPTSKAAFATHPKFVIPSVMGKAEVLAPDASQRVCGVFKGQLVYRRDDVSTARTAQKWLYEGRRVRDTEMRQSIKRRNVRKKPATKSGFQALRSYGVGASNDGDEERQIQQASQPLDDGMEDLFAIWQTDPWSPPRVGPQDAIPANEFNNIELALINPGLVHIDQPGLAGAAKKLGIPYAPCLLGFEKQGGNRTPLVRGIVVHEHNAQLVREAGVELNKHALEKEYNDRRQAILLRWKRLMVGLLTKARIDREYGSDEDK